MRSSEVRYETPRPENMFAKILLKVRCLKRETLLRRPAGELPALSSPRSLAMSQTTGGGEQQAPEGTFPGMRGKATTRPCRVSSAPLISSNASSLQLMLLRWHVGACIYGPLTLTTTSVLVKMAWLCWCFRSCFTDGTYQYFYVSTGPSLLWRCAHIEVLLQNCVTENISNIFCWLRET